MDAAARIAATPRPAPRPAARAVFELLEPEAAEGADEEEAADEAAAELAAEAAVVRPVLVPVAEPLSLLLTSIAALVLVEAVVVVVPSLTSAEALYPELVATYPGHDVLPMTVTVVGCDAPSLIAFRPVLQLHSESPGQQYQSWAPGSGHFVRGTDVLESVQRGRRLDLRGVEKGGNGREQMTD